MTLLKLENINIQYNTSDFSLTIPELVIEQNEFFGLIGESGCGKTTLLKSIGGLQALSSGKVTLDGQDITDAKAENRNMSMVFQESLLFPHMTALDNVAFPLKIRGIKKDERYKKALSYLEKVGLSGLEDRYPTQLSGGQQQRVSIARALIHEPQVILMDEPFSALDPELRDEMRHLVKSLQKKLNLTIIFVTHQLDEAALLFDRVAMISNGRIVQSGAPSEIYKAPNTIEVAKFFGFKNIYEGVTSNGRFLIDHTAISLEDAEAGAHCVLIPNHAILRHTTATHHTKVIGTVSEKTFVHGLIHFLIKLDSKMLHYYESMNGDKPIQVNDEITLYIQRDKLKYFVD